MTPIFKETKEAITLKSALVKYGLPKPKNNKIPCPFHEDKTPSMSVKNDCYHCFGCGASGDVISFVQRFFRLEKPIDAVKKLRSDFGLADYKEQNPEAIRAFTESEDFTKAFALWEKKAFIEVNIYLRDTLPRTALNLRENSDKIKELYQDYSTLEQLLDILTAGTYEEKIEAYKKYRQLVKKCTARNRQFESIGQRS